MPRAAPPRGWRRKEPDPGPAPALRCAARFPSQRAKAGSRGGAAPVGWPPRAHFGAEGAGKRMEEQGASLLSHQTTFPASLGLEPAPHGAKELSARAAPAYSTGHTCPRGLQGTCPSPNTQQTDFRGETPATLGHWTMAPEDSNSPAEGLCPHRCRYSSLPHSLVAGTAGQKAEKCPVCSKAPPVTLQRTARCFRGGEPGAWEQVCF